MNWSRALGLGLAIALCGGRIHDSFDLEYSLPDQVVLFEPIILDVVMRNGSDRPVHLDLGLSNVTNFRFEITKPDGSQEFVRPLGRDGFQPGGRYVVEPDRSVSAWIVLNEWLQLPMPGPYRIKLLFNGSVVSSGGTPLPVRREEERMLMVLPRDDGVLRARCEELLSQVRTLTGDDQIRAATALAHVFDPIAVPYLRESAELHHLPNAEMRALVRIGGPQARVALEALSRSSNTRTAQMARSALARIKE